MLNVLGREGGETPYMGIKTTGAQRDYATTKQRIPVFRTDLSASLQAVQDGMTLSFHHHLRNGDLVLDMVMRALQRRGTKHLHLAPSSIFPAHAILVDCFLDKTVTSLETAYVSGPVAKALSAGQMAGKLRMHTHGGRARAILEGECPIDVAFIAAPAVDRAGAISGVEGAAACGSLGYAVADAMMANYVVAITDNLVEEPLLNPDIRAGMVDQILVVDKIGDSAGIVSGTTRVTNDPVGLNIAAATAELIEHSGLFSPGFSFQTGAGGISLAVAAELRHRMKRHQVTGSFCSGGITEAIVTMLEEGLFEELYDVQAFDVAAVQSSGRNAHHKRISASQYANPDQVGHVAGALDVVVLGASEIDLDFNVNVTTGSDGVLLGGSGGHADTAAGAKLTIIVSKLVNARVSCLCERVTTITTPGETVDVLVTDRGIAINPRRNDLKERLMRIPALDIVDIETLYTRAIALTGVPVKKPRHEQVVGYNVYRDGTILDALYLVNEDA